MDVRLVPVPLAVPRTARMADAAADAHRAAHLHRRADVDACADGDGVPRPGADDRRPGNARRTGHPDGGSVANRVCAHGHADGHEHAHADPGADGHASGRAVRGVRAESAEMPGRDVVYGLRWDVPLRADSESEQRLSVVLGDERNHAVGRGMMGKCDFCGNTEPEQARFFWVCTTCTPATLVANARLGAAVREAYRRALDKVRGQPHQPQTIAEYVRNWAEFHDSGIGRAIADALEAEAGDVAG